MDLIKIKYLAQEIISSEEIIDNLETITQERGNAYVREMALQGKRLLALKSSMKHGQWSEWYESHLASRISLRRAQRYMQIANCPHGASLRQALHLVEAENNNNNGSTHITKHWPPGIELNNKLSKVVAWIEHHPIDELPIEQQEAAREKLLPLVTLLWPEIFGLNVIVNVNGEKIRVLPTLGAGQVTERTSTL